MHLVRRFCSSLSRKDASPEDRAWARTVLTLQETELWESMSPRDRRHAARTARRVEAKMGKTDHIVLAAALLHDVGKAKSRLGVPGRVVVTFLDPVVSDGLAKSLANRRGLAGELGKLLCYTELGQGMLEEAGSAEFISSWARQHHMPAGEWTVVDANLGRILQDADRVS
jgi:HD domain